MEIEIGKPEGNLDQEHGKETETTKICHLNETVSPSLRIFVRIEMKPENYNGSQNNKYLFYIV